MARIQIKDLPKNIKISEKEMMQVYGGLMADRRRTRKFHGGSSNPPGAEEVWGAAMLPIRVATWLPAQLHKAAKG